MGRRRPGSLRRKVDFYCLFAFLVYSDPGNIVLLTWIAFLINSFAAVQDVAVDGMAIDVPEEERERPSFMVRSGRWVQRFGSGLRMWQLILVLWCRSISSIVAFVFSGAYWFASA